MMPDLWSLSHGPVVELLGWTLLHFVWQGALLAAVLAGALHLLCNHTSRLRYTVSCVALAGLLALPFGTGLFLADPQPDTEPRTIPSVVTEERPVDLGAVIQASVAESASSSPSWQTQAASWIRPGLPWVVLGWGLGVLFFSVRLAGGAWRVRRLRRTGKVVPKRWQVRLQRLIDQMGIRHSVSLRQSTSVESPTLTGWWRPMVLVPTGLMTGLPPEQVEALLLHELAHIRRHDVLVGWLQAVVEVLLFFHPATWWISRQVRREREACCDDLVVQAGADRTAYARALTALAERVLGESPMAWTPAASNGSLLSRIRRLLSPPPTPSTGRQRLSMVAAVLFLVGVPVGLAACASQQTTTGTEETAQASSAPVESKEQVTIHGPDDSIGIVIPSESPITVDTLPGGIYALRKNGDRIDTLTSFSWEEREFDIDSLEQAIRSKTPVDSLARVIEIRMSADSLSHEFTERFEDSTFVFGHEDSGVDSLVAWADHHADSLSQVLEHHFLDGTDVFDWEAFERDIDVDSLLRMQERKADSLYRRHGSFDGDFSRRLDSLRQRAEQRAEHFGEQAHRRVDSLRRHLDRLQEHQEEKMPEHLREQARRLREQAKRLEERAEEMEKRSPSTPPSDSTARRGGAQENF